MTFFCDEELIKFAEIQRTHGINGEVLLRINPEFEKNSVSEDLPAFLIIDGMPVPFFIKSVKITGKNIVVSFKYIDTIELAEKFIGLDVMTINKKLPATENDEFENDFFGYSVIDEKFGNIGKVILFNDIPGNPVIELEYKNKNIIIPFAENIIIKIDDDNKEIFILAPEGLIEIYLQ